MKKYSMPHSFNPSMISGKEVGVVPALAGAVGALAGAAAAGVAVGGGMALGKKMFGDGRTFISTSDASSMLICDGVRCYG